MLYCILCHCTVLDCLGKSRRTSKKKEAEFFGHERRDLALQSDDFLMDPVIFALFLRNLCVRSGSGSGLEIFDFGPEPRKQKKKAPGHGFQVISLRFS